MRKIRFDLDISPTVMIYEHEYYHMRIISPKLIIKECILDINENNEIVVTTDVDESSKDSNTDYQETGELVVGLDIGTTKICCVVGEVFDDGV